MRDKILIWILIFSVGPINSYGQIADTTYFPSGQVKGIKMFQGDKIIKAIAFKEDGEVSYRWDIEKRRLESFDAISYTDTLAEYFTENCPDYTVYQHYGNGPLMEIENYKENKRHGTYEKYARDGKPIEKGQFANWEKVGTWTYYDAEGNTDKHIHWFHHGYSEGGISINYTIYPVAITILTVVGLLFLFLNTSSFSSYLIAYSIFTIIIYTLLMVSGVMLDDIALEKISTVIGRYVFPVLTTIIIWKTLISLTSLIFRKRTKVKLGIAILFLLTSFGLGLHLLYVYIGTKLSGIVM